MAASDHVKVGLRDRAEEHGRSPASDAVAGSAAGVLALQRTLGNRATTELLHAQKPRLLQRQLRGLPGVVSGLQVAPLDEQTGRRIIAEFSRNDPSSVPLLAGRPLGLMTPQRNAGRWTLDDQEWGLIHDNATGEVHLIEGEKTGVNWDPYLVHGTPLAHSHPWNAPGARREPTRTIPGGSVRLDDLLVTSGKAAGMMVLPTISDFVLPASRGQSRHTVYTPYVYDTGMVRDPGPADANTPRLVWELTDIWLDERSSEKARHHVSGRLTATSGGSEVWTRRVRAPLYWRPSATSPARSNLRSTKYRPLKAPTLRPPDDRAPWADAALADPAERR